MKLLKKSVVLRAIAALFISAPVAVHAQTISFSGLAGSNGSAFSSYNESGFNVLSLSGTWNQAQAFGNPTPSIFSSSTSASITVTRIGGGSFEFLGFALGNAGFSPFSFSFLGLANGASVFSSGTLAGQSTNGFVTQNNSDASLIDELQITVNKGQTTSYNIDNIQLSTTTTVPEPSTVALLGLGLASLVLVRKRRLT